MERTHEPQVSTIELRAEVEKVNRQRIDQSLNIAGSILDATRDVNDDTLHEEALNDELDTARMAVARARELLLTQPAQSYRFRIDWWTTILDKDEDETVILRRYPVRGYTIIEADDLDAARGRADSLCDVEFFSPTNDRNSAHGHDVVGGAMWLEERRSMSPGPEYFSQSGATSDYLGTVLPTVETWNFDDVKILDVAPMTVLP